MGNIILQYILQYLLEWLSTATSAIDWAKFTADANAAVDASIAKLIPIQWVDSMLDKVAAAAIDKLVAGVQGALGDQVDEAKLISDCAAKNWPAALADLEAILAKAVAAGGGTPAQLAVLEAVKKAQAA